MPWPVGAGEGRVVVGVIGGALIGFAIGAGVFLLLEPVLESATGWVRETQGWPGTSTRS